MIAHQAALRLRKDIIPKLKPCELKEKLFKSVPKHYRGILDGRRAIVVQKDTGRELIYLDRVKKEYLVEQATYLANKGAW